MSNAAMKAFAGLGMAAAGVGAFFYAKTPAIAAEDTTGSAARKKALIRRHSSGDRAFLPSPKEVEARRTANRGGGVQKGQIHDSEGSQLPTTRGY